MKLEKFMVDSYADSALDYVAMSLSLYNMYSTLQV